MALSLVSEPGDIAFARNPVVVSLLVSGGIVASPPANYRVLLEVFFEKVYGSGTYTSAALLQGLYDNAGNVHFDLSSILNGECRAGRTLPEVPEWGTVLAAKADNLRKYYHRYTEEYGSPPAQQAWTTSPPKLALDGGVSQGLFASGDFFAGITSANSLLTWQADGKPLGLTQPEYISWHNYTASPRSLVVQRTAYDVDNNATTIVYLHESSVTAQAYETIVLPIGFDVAAVASDVYKVVFRVVDAASDYEGGSPTYLGPSRTYRIDRDFHDSERYVQYLNSFGCPETWRCTGEYSKALSVSRQTAVRPLLPGYNAFATDRFQWGQESNNELTFRTGYIRRGDAEALAEMLAAGEIYDVSEDGYIPLLITTGRFDLTSTRRELHFLEFQAVPRLSMQNFSKQTSVGNPEGDAWQETDGQYWLTELVVSWD